MGTPKDQVSCLTDTVATLIANGQSLSPAVNVGGLRLCGIAMPAVWTGSALTFQMSPDGGTSWVDMYDDAGAEFMIIAGASRYLMLDPAAFAATQWLKIRSGTSAAPVAQAADRTLNLILRGV